MSIDVPRYERALQIVDAQSFADILGEESAEAQGAVAQAFRVQTVEQLDSTLESERLDGLGISRPTQQWNERWQKNGVSHTLKSPLWNIESELPFDLCFEVEITDESGQKFAGRQIWVPATGRRGSRYGWISPRDADEFAHGRTGDIPVTITLRPSLALALTRPQITRFYNQPLTFSSALHITNVEAKP